MMIGAHTLDRLGLKEIMWHCFDSTREINTFQRSGTVLDYQSAYSIRVPFFELGHLVALATSNVADKYPVRLHNGISIEMRGCRIDFKPLKLGPNSSDGHVVVESMFLLLVLVKEVPQSTAMLPLERVLEAILGIWMESLSTHHRYDRVTERHDDFCATGDELEPNRETHVKNDILMLLATDHASSADVLCCRAGSVRILTNLIAVSHPTYHSH